MSYKGGLGGSWRERVDMASQQFSVEAMVRGYHVDKDVREAVVRKDCMFVAEIADDGTSLASTPWVSSSF